MCSMNSLLMTSKAVGTGMLVNKAEMSKETNSSSPLIFTVLIGKDMWMMYSA